MTANTLKLKKRILVFASGEKDGGGSGFKEMCEYSRTEPAILDATIVGVVSNHRNGGVRKHAEDMQVPFYHWGGPYVAKADGGKVGYRDLVKMYAADFVMLSGWLKPERGLNPRIVLNIHPALLPGDGTSGEFGGKDMWGHYVHEAVYKSFQEGRVHQSGVTIHFVTDYDEDGYDVGPIVWQMPVELRDDDTPKTIGNRVNQVERAWQSHILNLVVNGEIFLNDVEGEMVVQWKENGIATAIPGLAR